MIVTALKQIGWFLLAIVGGYILAIFLTMLYSLLTGTEATCLNVQGILILLLTEAASLWLVFRK